MMKMIEVRKLSTNQLVEQSTKVREEISELRRRHYLGELSNVRVIRAKRKDLARLLTAMSENLAKEAV